jgi:hypothetical protein
MTRPLGVCAVDGCGKRLAGGGYCRKHYARFRRHGDPLGGSTDWGAARSFVEHAAQSLSDECIFFPRPSDVTGHVRLNVNGKHVGAHAYAAELRHGPKPTAAHEACHTCGKGALGCVNGNHLYWGTRKENVADMIAHGTARFFGRPMNDNSPKIEAAA